jgi:hypothetical protein
VALDLLELLWRELARLPDEVEAERGLADVVEQSRDARLQQEVSVHPEPIGEREAQDGDVDAVVVGVIVVVLEHRQAEQDVPVLEDQVAHLHHDLPGLGRLRDLAEAHVVEHVGHDREGAGVDLLGLALEVLLVLLDAARLDVLDGLAGEHLARPARRLEGRRLLREHLEERHELVERDAALEHDARDLAVEQPGHDVGERLGRLVEGLALEHERVVDDAEEHRVLHLEDGLEKLVGLADGREHRRVAGGVEAPAFDRPADVRKGDLDLLDVVGGQGHRSWRRMPAGRSPVKRDDAVTPGPGRRRRTQGFRADRADRVSAS